MSIEKKRVIFVCVGNSCRSQIAEGFARRLVEANNLSIEITSAGTRPSGHVNPQAIEVMRERGIDISHHTSNGVKPEELRGYAAVITMGCSDKDVCPVNFGGHTEDWGLEDPIGKPIEFFRNTRDEIEQRVIDLITRISQTSR